MEKLKAAIIGSGNIASTVHAPGYAALPDDVELVAVSDVNLENAHKLASEFGVSKVYADHRELLKEVKPQLVSVCVPNKFHFPIVCDCLEAGANVFCEKPPAVSYEEALAMHQKAKKAGKLLSFNFNHRFRGESAAMKAMIEAGGLGTVYAAKVQALRRFAVPGWGVFTNKELQGGGPLIDIGVHMLDLALYLMDFPNPVYACGNTYDLIGKKGGVGQFGAWDGGKFTVEDSAFGFVSFENGMSLTLETSFTLNTPQTTATEMNVHLYGDKAGVSLSPFMKYHNDGPRLINETIPFETRDFVLAGPKNFANAVLGREEAVVTSKNVLLTQRIISALYQSAQTKQPVLF